MGQKMAVQGMQVSTGVFNFPNKTKKKHASRQLCHIVDTVILPNLVTHISRKFQVIEFSFFIGRTC